MDEKTGRGGDVAHVWIRRNVLGLVAIFIALGGTAIAAQGDQGPKANQAKSKKGKRGPAGPTGPQGPAGPNNVTVVRTTVTVPNLGSGISGTAVCPAGQRATGGGGGFSAPLPSADKLVNSGPTDSGGDFDFTETGDVPDRWSATFYTSGGASTNAYVFAICQ